MDVSVRQLSNAYLPSWCKDITVIKNLVTMQAPGIGISNAGLTLPESISGCYADHAVENFFPRVRTLCGHGAQVIIEGREIQSDGEEKDKDNPTTKNNRQPQPKGRVSDCRWA